MSLILLSGNLTLDIVNVVGHYPHEDEELRASRQWVSAGGNAANTACVLAQHRHRCDLAGTLADDADARRIAATLTARQVNLQHTRPLPGASPVSYITLNQQTGSRTIVHHRDLPELSLDDFAQIPLEQYDWLHFEGRNLPVLGQMLTLARERLFDQPVSLEIEKVRPGLEALIPLADVIMFSRAYALAQGFSDAESFLRDRQARYEKIWMTCTWGEAGAWAIDQSGVILHAPAPSGIRVVDTIGAGDVFNAGIIHALMTGKTLEESLRHAVQLAGRKVRQQGMDALVPP